MGKHGESRDCFDLLVQYQNLPRKTRNMKCFLKDKLGSNYTDSKYVTFTKKMKKFKEVGGNESIFFTRKATLEKSKKKVLLLGMSYTAISSIKGKHLRVDPEAAIYLRIKNRISQIDGRDLARIKATEKLLDCNVYTISKVSNVTYKYREDRHLSNDYNSRHLTESLQKQFGKNVCFDICIFDYFWFPPGWRPASPKLFTNFVKMKEDGLLKPGGTVLLPFTCDFFCSLAALQELQEHFQIEYVTAQENPLLNATKEIRNEDMQIHFGKQLCQEELYCNLQRQKIVETMENGRITKEKLLSIYDAIPNVSCVRFIKLVSKPKTMTRWK